MIYFDMISLTRPSRPDLEYEGHLKHRYKEKFRHMENHLRSHRRRKHSRNDQYNYNMMHLMVSNIPCRSDTRTGSSTRARIFETFPCITR